MAANLGNLFISGYYGIQDDTGNHSFTWSNATIDTVNTVFGRQTISTNTGLYISQTAAFNIGYSDFTFDTWFRRTGNDDYTHMINIGDKSFFAIIRSAAGSRDVHFYGEGYSIDVTIPLGINLPRGDTSWHHIAFVRTSAVLKMYIDGQFIGQTAFNAFIEHEARSTGLFADGSNMLVGNVANTRLVNGEALWSASFNVNDEDALFYPTYIKIPASNIYGQSSVKGNLRGKCAEGWVRPTLKQFFTSADFTEIANYDPAYLEAFTGMNGSIIITPDKLTYTNPLSDWHGPWVPFKKYSGKWYLEYTEPTNSGYYVGVREDTPPLYPYHYQAATHISFLFHQLYHSAGHSYATGFAPSPGDTVAIGYDIDNRIFTVYKDGILQYTYDVDAIHPELRMADGVGVSFCTGCINNTVTIHATPTYEIPGYVYI